MSFRAWRRVAHASLAASMLAGCALVDQRTFDPRAGMPPVRPPPPAAPHRAGPPPLLTITFDTPSFDWHPALAVAVADALRAKPDVLFEVVTLVPQAVGAGNQVAQAEAASETGREIAEAIAADGADIGQIELAARVDPSVAVKTVRVYVH